MTLDQFTDLTATRIPTPAEFVEFARGQGWRLRVTESGAGSLWVPDPTDPLANSFARMLRREPWRSDVLKLVGGEPHAKQVAAVKKAVAGQDGEACANCGNYVYPGNGVTAEDIDALCVPPHRARCPYRTR